MREISALPATTVLIIAITIAMATALRMHPVKTMTTRTRSILVG